MTLKVGMNGINYGLLTKVLESEVTQEISKAEDSVTAASETTVTKTKNSSGSAFAERTGISVSGILQQELMSRISKHNEEIKGHSPFRTPRFSSSLPDPGIFDDPGATIFAPGSDSIATKDKLGWVISGEGNRGGGKSSGNESEEYKPHKQDSPQDNSDVTGDVDTTNGVDLDQEGFLRPADDGVTLGPKWMGNPIARQHIKIPELGGLDDSSDPNPDGVGGTDHKPGKGQPSGNGSTSNDDGNDNGSNTGRDPNNWGILGPYVRPQELSVEVSKNVTAKIKNK